MRSFAQRFHVLAVELGGLMIKVGQFLSSRLDVLPPEITKELEAFRTRYPPVPFPAVRALAERSWARRWTSVCLGRGDAPRRRLPRQAHRRSSCPPTPPMPGSTAWS